MQEKKEEFCKRNEEVSSARCQAVLVELSQELEDGICNKIYAVRGGYLRYLEKQNEIEMKYRSVPGKGIQVSPVLGISNASTFPVMLKEEKHPGADPKQVQLVCSTYGSLMGISFSGTKFSQYTTEFQFSEFFGGEQ